MKIIDSPLNNHPYIIYKITNLINGKIYIGRTTIFLSGRKESHLRRLRGKKYQHLKIYKAFKKYGFENFSIEVVMTYQTFKELKQKEKEHILHFNSMDSKIGYNMSLDTEDGMETLSPESIEKRQKNHAKHMFNSMKKTQSGYYKVTRTTKSTYRTQVKGHSFCRADPKQVAYIADLFIIHFYKEFSKLNFPENIEKYKTLNVFEEITRIKKEKQNGRPTFNELKQRIDEIVYLYRNKEYSSTQIAKLLNTHHGVILKLLEFANCERRSIGTPHEKTQNALKESRQERAIKTLNRKRIQKEIVNERLYEYITLQFSLDLEEYLSQKIKSKPLKFKDKIDIPLIKEMYFNQGISMPKIAKILKIGTSSIRRFLRRGTNTNN